MTSQAGLPPVVKENEEVHEACRGNDLLTPLDYLPHDPPPGRDPSLSCWRVIFFAKVEDVEEVEPTTRQRLIAPGRDVWRQARAQVRRQYGESERKALLPGADRVGYRNTWSQSERGKLREGGWVGEGGAADLIVAVKGPSRGSDKPNSEVPNRRSRHSSTSSATAPQPSTLPPARARTWPAPVESHTPRSAA